MSATRITAAALALALALSAGACSDRGPSVEATSDLYEADATVLSDASHGPELCLGGVADSLPPQCGGVPIANWDWAKAEGEESGGATTWGLYHVVGRYDGKAFTLTEDPGPYQRRPVTGDSADRFKPACEHPTGTTGPVDDGVDVDPLADVLVAAWASDPGPNGQYVFNVAVKPGHKAEAERVVRRSYQRLLCVVERTGPTARELDAIQDELVREHDRWKLVSGAPYPDLGYVQATLTVLTPELRDEAKRRWGDKVRLDAALRPVKLGVD